MPRVWQYLSHAFRNCGPLSLRIISGYPKRGKKWFSNCFVMSAKVVFHSGYASNHLANESSTVSRFVKPLGVLGYGPIRSTFMVWNGVEGCRKGRPALRLAGPVL